MADVYQLSQAFRAALLARDTQAAARLIAAYELGASRLEANLRQLLASVEAARARGETITDGWLYRQARFRELIQQAQQEMLRLSQYADNLITEQQRAEIERGLRDSATLMKTAADEIGINPSFAQTPKATVENLVGALGDGSPLRGVLGRYGIEGAKVIERELIAGLVAGEPIAKVARRMRSAVGGNLDKALQIARTETLRAYRESSRQNYLKNAEYISGYIWVSAKQVRTCLACLALDGQFFPLDKPLPAHVNCRCTSYAALKGEPPRQRETAAQWFARQPDSVKRQSMTADELDAFNAGRVTLQDFVGRTNSEKWGSSYHQLSLKRALAGEGKFPDSQPPK